MNLRPGSSSPTAQARYVKERNKNVGNLPRLKKHRKKQRLHTPVNLDRRDTTVDPERKVLYKKIHQYGKKEYIIEVSKTKKKFYFISLRMSNEKYEKIEVFYKQGRKMIQYCGGIPQLAQCIEFKYGKMVIRDMQHMLHDLGPAPHELPSIT